MILNKKKLTRDIVGNFSFSAHDFNIIGRKLANERFGILFEVVIPSFD